MLQWGATWGRLITFCCSQVLRQGVGHQAPQSPEAVTLEPSPCLGAREYPFATRVLPGPKGAKNSRKVLNSSKTHSRPGFVGWMGCGVNSVKGQDTYVLVWGRA